MPISLRKKMINRGEVPPKIPTKGRPKGSRDKNPRAPWWTPEEETAILLMAEYGLIYDQLAAVACCDVDTLRKHLGEKIELARAKGTSRIARAAHQTAEAGDGAQQRFILRHQGKWRDQEAEDQTPVQIIVKIDND